MKILVVAAIAGLVTGCGSGEPPSLDPARSGAQGVPIPASAEAQGEDPTNLIYNVPGADFESLSAWYERRLPEGQAWEQWAWCEQKRFTGTLAKTWHMEGTPAILSVVISEGDPPTVHIVRDASGPC